MTRQADGAQKDMADLRAALLARNEQHGTEFYLLVNEDQAIALTCGQVPREVKSMVCTMLDWMDEDQCKADAYRAQQARRTRQGKRRSAAPAAARS